MTMPSIRVSRVDVDGHTNALWLASVVRDMSQANVAMGRGRDGTAFPQVLHESGHQQPPMKAARHWSKTERTSDQAVDEAEAQRQLPRTRKKTNTCVLTVHLDVVPRSVFANGTVCNALGGALFAETPAPSSGKSMVA